MKKCKTVRIISLLLIVVLLFSITSCTTTEHEMSNSELNTAIDKIISDYYTTTNQNFIDYNIYSLPEIEFQYLEDNDYLEKSKPENYPSEGEYYWYDNGVINQTELYNKIINNTYEKGISITADIEKIARTIVKTAQANIDFLKEEYPEFPINIPLYYLDRISVALTDEEYAVGMYLIGGDKLLVNFENVMDKSDFEKVVAHELFHMFVLRTIDDVYMASSSYDARETEDIPLTQLYFEEFYVEYFARSALNMELDPLWTVTEKLLVDIMCASSGVDYTYFTKTALGLDDMGLLNSVEKELRNVNFVYSTLYAFEIANNYNSAPGDINTDEFRTACGEYAAFNFMKNAYVRNMKAVTKGEITYNEALSDIENLLSKIELVCPLSDEFIEKIQPMQDVFEEYIISYK